jgi:hypothetical protein
MRTYLFAILTILFVLNICYADGQTPRLEAIRNPSYGYGIISANLDNGILKVFRINNSSLDLLGTHSGYPSTSDTFTVCFDRTGLYDNKLHVSVVYGSNLVTTDILEVLENGTITVKATKGNTTDALAFSFDFTSGEHGYLSGTYLEDRHIGNGTSLYHMGADYTLTRLKQNWLPSGRTDMDVQQIKFDPTGRYNFYLTMIDSDDNDNKAIIYQLKPNLGWIQLTTAKTLSQCFYKDMCFSRGGSFGEELYVTDRVTNTVMTVDPNGIHEVFASGFNAVESITIDETGEFMYVSDYDGIWQIRIGTIKPGPQIIMQEPKVPYDDVFTGESGVSSVRFLWNEEIQFTNSDVEILNENGESVILSVSGSGSKFMIIAFGDILLNDKYTITIKDTVTSVATNNSIDGDKDGYAGGDAVIILEHRERMDSDNDNNIDLYDLAELAEKWLWVK